ncbi:hypothetical protein C2I36_08215 [Rhodobacteraceae bacterium WD3A24]|nr:hypothetical protein C2I36_08215 [Rhodobacteraceae bacterium WD3A24]
MTVIADILLAAGAFGAAAYCFVLSRRLRRFTQLEGGMGGAIAVLSAQVDDLTRAVESARGAANASAEALEAQTERAGRKAERLEILLASLHDLPAPEDGGAATGKGAADDESEARPRVRRRRQTREAAQ